MKFFAARRILEIDDALVTQLCRMRVRSQETYAHVAHANVSVRENRRLGFRARRSCLDEKSRRLSDIWPGIWIEEGCVVWAGR